MSAVDRGPLQTYEVIWKSGHVEYVKAHQCLAPPVMFLGEESRGDPRYLFHGEFDGRWLLVLSVLESDLLSVRLIRETADTSDEQ